MVTVAPSRDLGAAGNCRNAARKDSGINEASELSKAEEPSARAVPRLASSGAAAFSPCGWPVAPPAASRRGEAVPGEALSEERGPEAFPELSFVYLRSLGSALERECGECSRSTGGRGGSPSGPQRPAGKGDRVGHQPGSRPRRSMGAPEEQ